MKRLSFAVIGSGPAGFYISKCLSRLPQQPAIHIFEQEYCPFGLIRYGVAPDHTAIKKTENSLSSISAYPHFQYVGNTYINLSTLAQLRQQYSGLIFATGAQQDNTPTWMGKDEQKQKYPKVINARDLVYWYNQHPLYEDYQLDLSGKRDLVVVGNGNVAVDIARIILRSPLELQHSQISPKALQSLRSSSVRNVVLVARRGVTHSAFSLKQIRELTNYQIKIYCIEEELKASLNEASHIQCSGVGTHHTAEVRVNKRKLDFIKNKCLTIKKQELPELLRNNQRKVILRFLLDPIQVTNQALVCTATELKGEPFHQKAVRIQEQEIIPFHLLVNSTGFRVQSIEEEQLDRKGNCIANSNGCLVTCQRDKVKIGQYAVGWCKNGPRGVIDQTLLSCEETFNNVRIQVETGKLKQKRVPQVSRKVSFERYLALREQQLNRGCKQKFVKRKLSHREVIQFFNI